MSVAVRPSGDRAELGLPTKLFELSGMNSSGEWEEYAPARDGKRFLVKLPTQQDATQMRVLTNWTSLLARPQQ
jgi:hypothetical protein